MPAARRRLNYPLMNPRPTQRRRLNDSYRRAVVARIPRPLGNQRTYNFSRKIISNTSVSVPVGPGYAATSLEFQLGYLTTATDFTTLFDHYRIRRVTVEWIPASVGVTGVPAVNSPTFMACIDKDDGTTMSLANAEQRQGLLVRPFNRPIKMSVAPQALFDNGNIAATSLTPASTWIDCAHTNVSHRGIKFAILGDPNGATYQYCQIITYDIELKTVR